MVFAGLADRNLIARLHDKRRNVHLAAIHVDVAVADDLARLRAAGFSAFLIGESLMRQADPGRALSWLLAEAGRLRVNHELGATVAQALGPEP